MLKQRIFTAIALLVVLGAVLAAPGPLPFAVLLLVFAVLALFEWWRMTLAAPGSAARLGAGAPASTNLPGDASAAEAGLASRLHRNLLQGDTGWRLWLRVATSVLALWLIGRLLLDYSALGASLFALMGGDSEVLGFGSPGWPFALKMLFGRLWIWALIGWLVVVVYLWAARTDRPPFSLLLTAFGLLAVPAACTALLAAHGNGVAYLLSLLAVVWAADIGAYFVGRAVGGPKLAPRISPGKTISGALGGMVAAIAWVWLSSLFGTADTGFFSYGADLVARWTLPGALLLAALLAWLSIAGDLFESLLKRRAGRKDSSNLLPGHGGILDRIDAVLPVAPLAMLLVLLR